MIVSGTRSTKGDDTAIASANPESNRLIVGPYFQMQNNGNGPVRIKLKLGNREIYDVKLPDGVAVLLTDFPDEAGAGLADEDLYVNLDVGGDVYYQIQVREVTY